MRRTQSGNILFLILLAVVLFAALSYAVTQGMRGGGNNASSESGQAQSAEILNYFAQMDAAVQRMMVTGGVKDYELNFYYQSPNKFVFGSNDNTNCTASSCRVFDPAGGGVTGRIFPTLTRLGTDGVPRLIYIPIPGVGTSASDILIRIENVKTNICLDVNAKFGLNDFLYGIYGSGTYIMYQNVIPTGPIQETATLAGTPLPFAAGNVRTFCICGQSTRAACEADNYNPQLFHVLVAR